MNRKQGRGARAPRAQGPAPLSAAESARRLFGEAVRHQHLGKLNEAVRLYRQVLSLAPDHAEASNNLGCVYLAQGKLKEARARFARALELLPQLFDDFASVCAMLAAANPGLAEDMKRVAAAWPRPLPARELLGYSAAIAADPLLAYVMQSTIVRDIDLERLLTCVRRELLSHASEADTGHADSAALASCCTLARQYFL